MNYFKSARKLFADPVLFYKLNNNLHPSRKNSFYGYSINPYDVIFHKWYWHNADTVNFDIIKQYVDD